MTTLLWFRRDLRLSDNPALQAALESAPQHLLPIYIHTDAEESPWQAGAASRWWLDRSLRDLDLALRRYGSRLIVRSGPCLSTLLEICAQHGVSRLFWNRLYEPAVRVRDTRIKTRLCEAGILCKSCNAALLFEPWEIRTAQDNPYRVFSAFWRSCLKRGLPASPPIPAPASLPSLPEGVEGLSIDALGLKPQIPWDGGLSECWQPGEEHALRRLEDFLAGPVTGYADGRDLPGRPGTSRLSPHLHFGEIGPRQVLQGLLSRQATEFTLQGGSGRSVFVRELAWREFAHHLLYHFPQTCEQPLDRRFLHLPWQRAEAAAAHLRAWQRGATGIPIVDAGMRELWHTGWMHNRVRMIVASFLVKNLRIHWLEGARWFWDTLVDADLANNTLGWQWTAGCGADAAPYFRIFNPVRQSERFDPQGEYLRRWLPELASLPLPRLHTPWEADRSLLQQAGVTLGERYPLPLVDLKASREQTLKDWAMIKSLSIPEP